MAWEQPLQNISLIAAADLSAKQFYAVKVDSNGKAAIAGAGETAIGILQNTPTSGKIANVMTSGVTKAIYGGSVTAGNNLAVDANGKLVAASNDAVVVAVALETGSANEIRTVLLKSNTPADNNAATILSIPIKLAKITGAGDVVTEYVPGFAGAIKKVSFIVTDPATTASKAVTLNLEIGTTDLTGGAVALTSTNCGTLGAVVDGSAITGNNVFGATDAISVEASSVTAFMEGEGVLEIVIQKF